MQKLVLTIICDDGEVTPKATAVLCGGILFRQKCRNNETTAE
jgi:hypothetical protein